MTTSEVNSQAKTRKRGKTPKQYRFYNPKVGEIECTTRELWEYHARTRETKHSCAMFYALTRGDILKLGKSDDYWILLESEDSVTSILKSISQPGKKPQKYKFYNLEKGEIECTVKQLQRQYIKEVSVVKVHSLANGRIPGIGEGINRWVLAENKDLVMGSSVRKPGKIPKRHKFYNPEVGEIECTTKELWEQYIEKDEYSFHSVSALARGSILVLGGHWMLAKNRSSHEEGVLYNEKVLKLIHPDIGVKEFTRKEFLREVGGTKQGISLLVMGRLKSYKGWSVLT